MNKIKRFLKWFFTPVEIKDGHCSSCGGKGHDWDDHGF